MFIYFIYYNGWLNYSISRTSNFLKLDQLIEVSPPDYLLGEAMCRNNSPRKWMRIWYDMCIYIYIYIYDIYTLIQYMFVCVCMWIKNACLDAQTNQTHVMSKSQDSPDGRRGLYSNLRTQLTCWNVHSPWEKSLPFAEFEGHGVQQMRKRLQY